MIRTPAVIIFAMYSLPAFADGKCFTPPGQEVAGAVDYSRHYDGDTFYIGRDRVRVWGIDAPERDEYGYKEAAEALRALTWRLVLTCRVQYVDKTPSRRCVAVCRIPGGRDLGEALLRDGWAKIHRSYINEYSELKPGYEAAEARAREERRGIWR